MADLQAEELVGGHTIERHVGKSEDELRQRLVDEALRYASSFVDLSEAEAAVNAALDANSAEIAGWVASFPEPGRLRKLVLHHEAPGPVGRLVAADNERVDSASRVRVVLWRTSIRDNGYIVLTAFPEP